VTATPATTGLRPAREADLRGLLDQVTADPSSQARLLLVAAAPRWDGPPVLDTERGPVRVVEGPSPLAVRIAMADHPDEFLIVLTPLDLDELGEEIAARAWRHNIRRPSPWDAVTSLFKVSHLDPSLRDEQWMVDLLVQLAPPGGYPQPASGMLDRETAWRQLFRHALGLPLPRPSPAELLSWLATPEAQAALSSTGPDARQNIAARLAVTVGPAAEVLTELAAAGTGHDLVSLGLVVDAVWPAPDPAVRIRLEERHLQQMTLRDPAAADWAAAAATLLADGDTTESPAEVVTRAEALLNDLDPNGTADSALLPSGLTRRLERFGTVLQQVLTTTDTATLRAAEDALARVREHTGAAAAYDRIVAAEAAVRLLRRFVTVEPAAADVPDGDLATQSRAYLDDGAWVDAARHRIAEGETLPTLTAAYHQLLERIDDQRRTRDRRYAVRAATDAATLTPPSALDPRRPLPIESVLDSVLAPLARQRPVLLLIVDGLAHAALPPFLEGLETRGWQTHGPAGEPAPPVVAALPTVTTVSRTSLLTGTISSGGQDKERQGFASHAGLLAATDGQPPVLFHKRDLRTAEGEIAPAAREAIADPDQQVVGVVVNAADDHLAKGDQLRLADGLDGIPVLRPLLEDAIAAERTVVLTSDHGHILGSTQRVVSGGGGGERYRADDGRDIGDDEVRLEGTRVVSGPIVAGADDGVRYTPEAKHGYHGGATPAEVLCPLLVLTARDVELDGWQPRPLDVPAWWDPTAPTVDVDVAATVGPPPTATEPAGDEPQLSLLDTPTTAPPAAGQQSRWLSQLLASPRLADQRRLTGRATLDDDDLARLLQVLVAAGGTASGSTLQRALGLPATRLRSKLAAARSLLDVDGYAVLRLEADGTAALNLDLLAQQFEIDRPGGGGAQ
jgi:hypothetical protein